MIDPWQGPRPDKAALIERTVGKDRVILFAFQSRSRGQSLATFDLLRDALTVGLHDR
jgi:hypothetical protein